MPEAENIEDWRGREVRDSAGDSLGKLNEVYFDPQTHRPVLAAIKSGLLGRRSRLVPLDDATVAPDHVRVAYPAATIEDADAQELPAGDEEFNRLGDAYGVRFRAGLQLESASEIELRNAEADAARKRAEELDAAAQAKGDEYDTANQRAQDASQNAEQARRDAQEAQRAADEARSDAERHDAA